jgi:hypothetical protein
MRAIICDCCGEIVSPGKQVVGVKIQHNAGSIDPMYYPPFPHRHQYFEFCGDCLQNSITQEKISDSIVGSQLFKTKSE